MRSFAFACLLLPFVVAPSRADMVSLGVPAEYTPGTPFAVDVGLFPVFNLGLYNVEVVFGWTAPGTLTVAPPTAAGSGYVFASSANFLAGSSSTASELRVTLSDFTLDPTGPDVVTGVNDRLATLILNPSADLASPIQVSIDRTSLFIDDANGQTLLTDGTLPEATITASTVPAPAGVVCALLAIGTLGLRRRYL